jgi:hypothetical protein
LATRLGAVGAVGAERSADGSTGTVSSVAMAPGLPISDRGQSHPGMAPLTMAPLTEMHA